MKNVTLYYFDLKKSNQFLKILKVNQISVSHFCKLNKIKMHVFFTILDGVVPIESGDLLKWFSSIYPIYFQALCSYFKFCFD